MSKFYVIAEMGVNFYDTAKALNISPLEAAKMYIDGAAEAGCDCAKFQSYKANTIVSKTPQPTGIYLRNQQRHNMLFFRNTMVLMRKIIENFATTHTQREWISLPHHLITPPLIIWRIWLIFIRFLLLTCLIYHSSVILPEKGRR